MLQIMFITFHIRSTTGGYVFTSVSVNTGGTPVPGSFPDPFQGVPKSWLGYSPPPGQVRMGYRPPARPEWVTPSAPGQNRRVSTCHAAGGMPLAFTLEDYLVFGCNTVTIMLNQIKIQAPRLVSNTK